MRNIPNFLAIPVTMACTTVYAVDYLNVEQAQQLLFAGASAINATITLSEQQKDAIKSASGVRQRSDKQEVWRMEKDGVMQGWLFIDDVIGKHEFISYALAIDLNGQVLGIEILSYRETHGGQVRLPKWRENFVGKTRNDTFKLNRDIPNISGATLSCRNVTDGVKRLLVLHHLVLAS
ncbi:FMN-binding protein [Colwelliaceae bacterium 6471]